jgi:hypothetical protein
MFFTFPRGRRWNAEWQAVKFGVEIGEYRGVGPGRPAGLPTAAPRAAHPRRERLASAHRHQPSALFLWRQRS